MPLLHAAPSLPRILDSLHQMAKSQSHRPPYFLSGHAYQDGKSEHRGDFTQEASLVCGICDGHGGYETAEVRDVRRIGGGRGLCGEPGKRVDAVFPGRPHSFRHHRRPVDDGSPGRGEMVQNGGTRSGTCHGEMNRCRESQGWTTACSGMPERDGKEQEEDSPKQAGSCWFGDATTSFSGVTFVLFCLVFVVMLSLKPPPFVQSSFDVQAPR